MKIFNPADYPKLRKLFPGPAQYLVISFLIVYPTPGQSERLVMEIGNSLAPMQEIKDRLLAHDRKVENLGRVTSIEIYPFEKSKTPDS